MRTRSAILIAAVLAAFAAPALADPFGEARSATAACLAAVIDKAPVETIKGTDVDIRRDGGFGPCTVEVRSGAPDEVKDAVQRALAARSEGFAPALTKWDPGTYASTETYCNAIPSRRALNVVVTVAKPGADGLVLTATVLEPAKRDPRCDEDRGLQPAPLS